MELEYLNSAELADLQKESPRPSAHAHADATLQPLRQLQHGLGNRALGQLIQAKYADDGDKVEADRHSASSDRSNTAAHSDGADPAAIRDTSSASKSSNSSGGDGRPLGEDERAFFEPRFKEDFSGVRLHTGAEAAESARSIGARAYATGQNIVFADGHYAPHTEAGARLLAHELAHVVQQRRPGGGGASSPESGAHAASEAVASGHAISPRTIGSAAPGLYADNGFSLTPALADSSSSFGAFKLPPLKVSRKLLLYLITNGLMTTEMRQMLLRGEIVVEEDEPKAASADKTGAPGEAGKSIFDPRGEYDDLLRRVTSKRTAEEEAAARVAPTQGPSPYAEQTPLTGPLFKPDPKKVFEFKGLMEGLDINIPHVPVPLNLSVSGLTLDVLRKGRFDAKLVAGFDQSIEVQLTYRDWHLSASVDTDGKWLMKLSYPNDSPMPVMSSIDAVFQQGERALREALNTFRVGPGPNKFDALKDRVTTLATPIKSAVDAAQGVAKIQRGMNVSIVVGAGPAPGKLPSSALEGVKQPSTPSGVFAGFQLTFYL